MGGVSGAVAQLEHELVGPPDAPVILALGGISASRHVTGEGVGAPDGWWPAIAGRGRALDTRTRRVLGVEYLDGGRAPDGRPASLVTTHDQAEAIVALLDQLGIERLDAVVGASYGGMVALALAERWPGRVGRVVAISAAHESTPMSTALRALQRHIVELGLDTGSATQAMTLARALAMTTYRSAAELAVRFPVVPDVDGATASFDVERYLLHAGAKFAARTPPERFLALSLSADLHRVAPEAITVPVAVVAATGDTLVPAEATTTLASRLPNLLGHATLESSVGHDAFLVEPGQLAAILSIVLADSDVSRLL